MANRHLLRSTAMQTLYEIDVTNRWEAENLWEVIGDSIDRLGQGITDLSYLKEVLSGILGNKQTIDDLIGKHATGWSVETIAPVERNILRVAVYEMAIYRDEDIPPKVSINEAIELGKTFSGKPAGKFINGVLGGLFKELDQPKEQ